jgi:hypothetical protein
VSNSPDFEYTDKPHDFGPPWPDGHDPDDNGYALNGLSAPEVLREVASVLANTRREMVPLAAVLATLYEVADQIEGDQR